MAHRILITTPRTVFNYVACAIRELIQLQGVEWYWYLTDEEVASPKPNPLITAIDKRYSVFRQSPYSTHQAKPFFDAPNVYELKAVNSELEFDYLLQFSRQLPKVDFGCKKIIRPDINIEKWCASAIYNEECTEISLYACDDHLPWHIVKRLSFRTERGVYNNRDKALFSIGFLIAGYIQSKNLQARYQYKIRRRQPRITSYYFKLAIILLGRKWFRKNRNWKLAYIAGEDVKLLSQPAKTFWADPFPVKNGDDTWVFFEELDERGLGIISCVRWENGQLNDKTTVLKKDFHLSFPNVFEMGGNFYMMPEQSEAGRLDVYRAVNFPYQWECFKTLLHGIAAVDPVWTYHNGKYWLFFNKVEDYEHENNERLYIYHAEELFTDQWTPHSKNPVVMDISRARNAGRIFKNEDGLFRVSQNSRNSYGSEVVLNKILRLDEDEYEEVMIGNMNDFNAHKGMHTLNEVDGLLFTDFLVEE